MIGDLLIVDGGEIIEGWGWIKDGIDLASVEAFFSWSAGCLSSGGGAP